MLVTQRSLFEGEVLTGAEVVHPQPVGPWSVRPRPFAVEEQHVRLDAARVEDAGGQTQQGVDVVFVEQSPANRLTRTTLEQHIVGHDDRRSPVDGEQ